MSQQWIRYEDKNCLVATKTNCIESIKVDKKGNHYIRLQGRYRWIKIERRYCLDFLTGIPEFTELGLTYDKAINEDD